MWQVNNNFYYVYFIGYNLVDIVYIYKVSIVKYAAKPLKFCE